MKIELLILITTISFTHCVKSKQNKNITNDKIKKILLEKHEEVLYGAAKNKNHIPPVKITDVVTPADIVPVKKVKKPPQMIPLSSVQEWAEQISERLNDTEKEVVHRDVLLSSFSDVKMVERNGTAIVHEMATALEELLDRRARAAEAIMRRAEELAESDAEPDSSYTFDYSVGLDQLKKKKLPYEKELENTPFRIEPTCRGLGKLALHQSKHFDGLVSLNASSVYVSAEVFDCDARVANHIYWSEGLLSTFKNNYAQDSSMDFQYFCSAQGFLRHYPAALWDSMFKLKLDVDDVYDCRLRPWYVSAGGAPRDVLILLDASGSMDNSSNQVNAEQFTLALLSALTDDDRVNVLRFNVLTESPISCFNEKLVPANHVNSAAMMAALKLYGMINETWMADVLQYAVRLLQKQDAATDRPRACQQAVVLLTDSLYDNYTDLMNLLDPDGRIRLFTIWLHDPNGLRDHTRWYGEWLSCDRDGYFAELITHADVTEQVHKILQVLERPLVAQRVDRLKVFSDVYAHVEDPRRSEYYWKNKENAEQVYRYRELRKNKARLLNSSQLLHDHMRQINYDKYGHYYEGEDLNYRLQISVSVPVFDHRTSENITVKLNEEKQRNATRTYPVNRLLGVAGVDIPIEHLKLILPYHEVGAGGSLFIVDHRGNIVLHDNMKPVFDGDVLKPGYRTVDFLDLEQPAERAFPRHYSKHFVELRDRIVIDEVEGNASINGKNIYENGMRAILEMRYYYWKRVLDHYTAVVVLPQYNRRHPGLDSAFTKELAEEALTSLSATEFVINPDWLYCRHVEPHFDTREAEVRHFVRRRKDEANFAMRKLQHTFSPITPPLLDKTYQCDEDLMARFCKEVIATDLWARQHEDLEAGRHCGTCELGSVTAFYAGESGLTRWQQYHATSPHAQPPDATWWAGGPAEPWYRRAVSSPGTLVIHAPVAPISKKRNSYLTPPAFTIKSEWLTAARTLDHPKKGIIGVAGYHFYPQHLVDFLKSVTNFPCPDEDESDCDPRCDGKIWACVLVDENGWVVAKDTYNASLSPEKPLREHLATLHPAAMAALLRANIFQLNWIHDYQGVCFPDKDEDNAAANVLPTILKSLWSAVSAVLYITQEMAMFITLLYSGGSVSGDTTVEREKRHKRLRLNYEREKYERLFDPRVLINRTRFAACDRTRPLYVLNTTHLHKLNAEARQCGWPLVGAPVRGTNLLLLAVYTRCPAAAAAAAPDPLHNRPYIEVEGDSSGVKQSAASRLACWRNREPMRARAPHTTCYAHNYSQEIGYRQCGPWLPDPEEEDAAIHASLSQLLLTISLILFIIN